MKKLILVAITLVLSNTQAMAKDLKVCGVRSSLAAELTLERQAKIYCGSKKKIPFAETQVFDDKPKKMWATDQYGRIGVITVACYKQSFSCTNPTNK